MGVPSWTWYYPFHYAPFAADMVALGSDDVTKPQLVGDPQARTLATSVLAGHVNFEIGEPFPPIV